MSRKPIKRTGRRHQPDRAATVEDAFGAYRMFLEGRRIRGERLDASTVEAYIQDARRFEKWQSSKEAANAKAKSIQPFLSDRVREYFDEHEWSYGYVKRLVASLGHWSAFRVDACDGADSPLFPVRSIEAGDASRPASKRLQVSIFELLSVLTAMELDSRPTEGARNVALLRVLFGSGISAVEACGLRWLDTAPDAEEFMVSGRSGSRRVPISEHVSSALITWRRAAENLPVPVHPEAYVFPVLSATGHKRFGAGLSPSGVRALLGRYGQRARLSGPLNSNVIRAAFSREARRVGLSANEIRHLQGLRYSSDSIDENRIRGLLNLMPSLK